jgi:D-3-phosphoglycerate dehydrogenase
LRWTVGNELLKVQGDGVEERRGNRGGLALTILEPRSAIGGASRAAGQTVFVTAPALAPCGVERLERAGCRVLLLPEGEGAAAVERIMASEPVAAVISRTLELSARAIEACPTLRVVAKHGVGVGNIDVAACTRARIPVFTTPGANAQSVAELTLALMLAAARRLAWMDREIRDGRWPRVQDGLELRGRRLGLVGFGQVGRKVACVGAALGMRVRAFDPGHDADDRPADVEMMGDLDELIASSDVLSLHVPLNAQTRGLIDAARLARLPQGAILINTARGEVVDESALVAALRGGRLFGAGLDTLAQEPVTPDNPLLALPSVVLSPHVGGSTPAALAAMAEGAVAHVLGFIEGRPVDRAACVNPEVLA